MKSMQHVVVLVLVMLGCAKGLFLPGRAYAQAAVTTPVAQTSTAAPSIKTIATEKTETLQLLGGQSFTFVKRVVSIDRQRRNMDDENVEWWELRDAAHSVIYRQSYGPTVFQDGGFRENNLVDARVLKTKLGSAIAIEGLILPSAPNSGIWIQVFGIFNGKLVAFGPSMTTDGQFAGETLDSFTPSVMIRGQKPHVVERDVLNFEVWTGDFSIIYPVFVDWMNAKLRPAWRCLRTSGQGQIDRCRYKIKADPHREPKDLTFVRLFHEPEEGLSTPGHVVIKPESSIEYVEAEAPVEWNEKNDFISITVPFGSPDVWLHVKIDGQDGWIHTEEDLNAVGLEQAG